MKCWAASLGTCSDKLSREHLVSSCLFNNDHVNVTGFPWCGREVRTIKLDSLVSKILCVAHNNALSELDETALQFFDAARESIRLDKVRRELKPTIWKVKRMEVDARRLERWFLKTLINLSYKRELIIGPGTREPGVPPDDLVEIAFGLTRFEGNAGMYLVGQAGEKIDSSDRVTFTPISLGRDNLAIGKFIFRGFRFYLNLLNEPVPDFDGSAVIRGRDGARLRYVIGRHLSHVVTFV